MSGKSSGADTGNSADAKSRQQHHDGSSGRAYTTDQKSAVIRVRKCSPTAFYDILGLETVRTTCTDGEIKKAYRKLSLLTHPDKNGYDGADEAFKSESCSSSSLSLGDHVRSRLRGQTERKMHIWEMHSCHSSLDSTPAY